MEGRHRFTFGKLLGFLEIMIFGSEAVESWQLAISNLGTKYDRLVANCAQWALLGKIKWPPPPAEVGQPAFML